MKKSLYIGYDLTKGYEHCAEKIKSAGFTHTFLNWETRGSDCFEQVRICERLGLEIETAHTSFANINAMWLDAADGDDMTERFVQDVYNAKACGIPVLIVHVSSGFTPPPYNELGLSRFRKICEVLRQTIFIVATRNGTARIFLILDGYCIILGFVWCIYYIIGISFDVTKQLFCIKILKQTLDSAFDFILT